MKKILFPCLLALGIGANAQYNFTGTFEDAADGYYGQFGGGTVTAAAACNGSYGGQLALSATTPQTGWMVQMDTTGQISNGMGGTLSFSYKKSAGLVGTARIAYMVKDQNSGSWNVAYVGDPINLTTDAMTSCTTVSATIPGGVLAPDAENGVGVWVTRASGTGNFYVDDIKIVQDVPTTVPNCTTFTLPTAGSTIPAGTNTIKWTAAPNTASYKVTIGTTSGGTDVYNATVSAANTTANVSLLPNKTYYAKVTPVNPVGAATGCQEITFSTNSSINVCGPLTTNQPGAVFPISSMTFSGTTKTSPSQSGTVSPYEDFRSTVIDIPATATTLPITVQGVTNGNPSNGWATAVFIDWNNDGDFDDAGEQYFNTMATKILKTGVADNPVTLTGNITVPPGTAPGLKTMRVKYNFMSGSSTAMHPALATACSEMGNGQAEDYTLNFGNLAVNDINKSKVSVYPNPFKDVLKISDVKNVNSVIVTDLSGRTVKTLAAAEELHLGELKKGVYIVTIKMNDGTSTANKVIKD
ncbi:GEVED domain-containing protein [Soonwooa sp.]|uniref:T9SS type A sorting domain-containing protein n=1 Tax=Soonwooa sp. TaxID=1938592 RepID=UPI002613BFEC|nr:GEVED domain-containing protein [Soonwooa sp.]